MHGLYFMTAPFLCWIAFLKLVMLIHGNKKTN